MNYLLVIALVATVEAKAKTANCNVGEWGAWSDWSTGFNTNDVNYWKIPEGEQPTTGEVNRKVMMKVKAEIHAERRKCLADESCPEFAHIASEGYSPCIDGLAGAIDCPCDNIDQMSFVSFEEMGFFGDGPTDFVMGNDIWGWTSASGSEYAIMGTSSGTAFVDVTDATNPVPVGVLNRPAGVVASPWRDIKVIGDVAYIVSEARDSGIQVFDLTRLEGNPPFQYFTEDYHYTDLSNCHNIVANQESKMLYAVGCTSGRPGLCGGGLYILDATKPLEPVTVGCYGGDGYTHDTECVLYHGPDADYTDKEICFAYNEDSFTIVDVNDKSNIQLVSRTAYAGFSYTHQGAVSTDHSVVLLDDEGDESSGNDPYTKTYIWDVSDLDNPVLKTVYYSSQPSVDHNQYIVGDFTYQANYESGLRILKLDGFNLVPVAHFDVLPSRTTPDFLGSWSVYPYFASGTVVVSSIDYGLYVLRPNMPAMIVTAASRTQITERQRFRQVLETTDLTACPRLSERETV